MGTYFDGDGLYRKMGTTKAVPNTGGEFKNFGPLRTIEFYIDLTTLTTTNVIQSDQIFFPTGVRIEEVEVVAETAATTGTSAALNVGLMQTDRSTVTSATGLVNALAVTAYDAAGEKNVLRIGSTGVGALVGTSTAQVNYITAATSTGTFTAGRVMVRVSYMKVL